MELDRESCFEINIVYRKAAANTDANTNPYAQSYAHSNSCSNAQPHTYPYTNTYAHYMYSCLLLHVSYRQ
jgi:hypothetical protein